MRAPETRYQASEPLRSVSWHSDGKQFMCSHSDGSLTTWNTRVPIKPVGHTYPHGKVSRHTHVIFVVKALGQVTCIVSFQLEALKTVNRNHANPSRKWSGNHREPGMSVLCKYIFVACTYQIDSGRSLLPLLLLQCYDETLSLFLARSQNYTTGFHNGRV